MWSTTSPTELKYFSKSSSFMFVGIPRMNSLLLSGSLWVLVLAVQIFTIAPIVHSNLVSLIPITLQDPLASAASIASFVLNTTYTKPLGFRVYLSHGIVTLVTSPNSENASYRIVASEMIYSNQLFSCILWNIPHKYLVTIADEMYITFVTSLISSVS